MTEMKNIGLRSKDPSLVLDLKENMKILHHLSLGMIYDINSTMVIVNYVKASREQVLCSLMRVYRKIIKQAKNVLELF